MVFATSFPRRSVTSSGRRRRTDSNGLGRRLLKCIRQSPRQSCVHALDPFPCLTRGCTARVRSYDTDSANLATDALHVVPPQLRARRPYDRPRSSRALVPGEQDGVRWARRSAWCRRGAAAQSALGWSCARSHPVQQRCRRRRSCAWAGRQTRRRRARRSQAPSLSATASRARGTHVGDNLPSAVLILVSPRFEEI